MMAKARIGHFVEAQILESLEVDYIDESEVLTPADEANHINKWKFTVPFVCGAVNLGEALRRISEGAAMIRTKGEAGTGNVVEAVRHMRTIMGEIRRLQTLRRGRALRRRQGAAGALRAGQAGSPRTASCRWSTSRAGGIATPADAALMMQLGAEGVFVGSGIFKSEDPQTPRQRHRQGDDQLPRRRRPGRGLAWASARRCPASTPRACPKKPRSSIAAGERGERREPAATASGGSTGSCRPSPALDPRGPGAGLAVGVLALQGDFREHRVDARAARRAHA